MKRIKAKIKAKYETPPKGKCFGRHKYRPVRTAGNTVYLRCPVCGDITSKPIN